MKLIVLLLAVIALVSAAPPPKLYVVKHGEYQIEIMLSLLSLTCSSLFLSA